MHVKLLALIFFFPVSIVNAQDSLEFISESHLRNFVSFLSADSLKGRSVLTAGNECATAYIEEYFKTIGLVPLPDSGYRHRFIIGGNKSTIASNIIGLLPGKSKADEYIVIS